MPRTPLYTLTWSQGQTLYELSTPGHLERCFRPVDDQLWLTWLDTATSFTFQGVAGRLNVYKEERPRGGAYWYAYHTTARRTHKRYLGRTSRVTFARLEAAAQALHGQTLSLPLVPTLPLEEREKQQTREQFAPPREMTQQAALLASKLVPPRLPSALVTRERLFTDLDAARAHRLTLLSASGGWGKTTLLSSWAYRCPDPVAWLSLDAFDNDPVHFWRSVIAALRQCLTAFPALGEETLALLTSRQPSPTLLMPFLAEVQACSGELFLILDDYQLIDEQAVHHSLSFVLEHLPTNLHLVLSSRADPPLALSQLRVRGELLEVREEDLRFTEEETSRFLRQALARSLSETEEALLAQRTEGWIAGLQFATLAMHKCEDLSAFVRSFAGHHRYLLAYVQEHLLVHLSEPLQNFLLHSAVLTRMAATVCQAVTETSSLQESAAMLESIRRANLFLVPLDEEQRWYRLHDLFREALLARLHATQPETVPLLHQRAARWYERQGLLAEAISHALEASEYVYGVKLLERWIIPQSWRYAYHTLRRWLARLPEEVLRTRSDLCLLFALAVIFTTPRGPSALRVVEMPLQWAEQGFQREGKPSGVGAVHTVRAVLLANQGDFARSFALARHALTLLPEDDRQWRGHCFTLLGAEAASTGQLSRAQPFLLQARALSDHTGSLPGMLMAQVMLGDLALSQGELHLAARMFRQALSLPDEQQELQQDQLGGEMGSRDNYYERPALYGLAALAYERNHLEEAALLLEDAFSQGYHAWFSLLTPGILLRIRLFVARGEFQQAQDFLDELAARVPRPEALREIQCGQAWLALQRGDLARAVQWASSSQHDSRPLPLSRRDEEVLLLARLRIAEGQPDLALDLLASRRQEASLTTRRHSALQFLLVETLAYEASGARAQAKETLLQACTQAHREAYQRLFLDEGAPIETVLKALTREPLSEALAVYVRTLLYAFARTRANAPSSSPGSASGLAEPLTAQEQRVLRLLADGLSNQEIADQLIISLPTAKKHVANILSKLGAQNRTQAVTLARAYAFL